MNTWTWLGSTFFGQLGRKQVWSEGMVANQLCRIVVGISSQIGRDGHLDMGDVSTGRAASRGALATRHLHHARGIRNVSKKTLFFFYWVQPISIYCVIERHVISIHCIERHVSMTQCIDMYRLNPKVKNVSSAGWTPKWPKKPPETDFGAKKWPNSTFQKKSSSASWTQLFKKIEFRRKNYSKPPQFDQTSRFESLCRYSEIQVFQSISESENGKRPALSRKRSIVLNIWQ